MVFCMIWLGWLIVNRGGDLSLRDRLWRLLISFASKPTSLGRFQHTLKPTKKPHNMGIFDWLGWLDSNQRMTVSKTVALPLGDTPSEWNYSKLFLKLQEVFLWIPSFSISGNLVTGGHISHGRINIKPHIRNTLIIGIF